MKADYGNGFVEGKSLKTKGEMKIENNRHRNRWDLVQILTPLLIIASSHIELFKNRFWSVWNWSLSQFPHIKTGEMICSRSLRKKKKSKKNSTIFRQRIHSPWILASCCPQAKFISLDWSTVTWRRCIRNEFINCSLHKRHAEISYQPICKENCPWWGQLHHAGVYWG